jgi:hypothetical protein
VPPVVSPIAGRRAAPLLLSVLLGCSQSLFDEHVDDDGTIDDDGGDTAGDDGGDDGDDGGDNATDDGGDDGGEGCPAPCQGDPVADFTLEQGGANGRWFYLVDRGDADGAGFDELAPGEVQGADAWVSGDAGPAIVNCAGGATADVCAGVDDSLVLVPAPEGATAPVLVFVPPARGSYRLTGTFRLPQGFEEGQQRRFVVSRNARHDTQLAPSFLTSVEPSELSVDVEALAGDRILVSLPAAGDGSPIAFDFSVTLLGAEGEIFPGKCSFAATFDGEEPLADLCAGATLRNINNDMPDNVTVPGASLSEEYGDARVFAEGQFIFSEGSPMDYRADFTIQFWANVATPQPSFDTVLYSDWDSDVAGGTIFFLDETEPLINVCYFYDDGSGKAPQPAPCLGGAPPRDDAWHFFRVSRSAEAGTISLCIDGAHQSTLTEQGAFDMTSDISPNLGRNVYGSPYFAGSIDDLRIYKRALPCRAAP